MPVPGNDNFANATVLPVSVLPNVVLGITQFDATLEGGEYPHNSNQSVWYKITPTVTGRYRFIFSNFAYAGTASINDGQIYIALGKDVANSLATFTASNTMSNDNYRTELGWAETYSQGHTSVEGILTSGTTYYLRIGAYTGAGTNSGIITMDMSYDFVPVPANDNFANAITMDLEELWMERTTVDATQEGSEAVEYFGGSVNVNSVWFKFTPSSTRRYRINVDYGTYGWYSTAPRLGIAVYSGSTLATLTRIGAFAPGQSSGSNNAIADGTKQGIEVALTSGIQYYIRIDSPDFVGEFENAHAADFQVIVEHAGTPSAPSNNNIANALDLGANPADSVAHNITTKGATYEAWEATGGYDQPSVWMKFTNTSAVSREMHLISLTEGYSKPYYELYKVVGSDPPTAWSDLSYIDGGTYGLFTESTGPYDCAETIALAASSTYYIYVSDWNWYGHGYTDDYTFVFGTYVPPAPPPNDNFYDAFGLGYPYALHTGPFGDPDDWTQSNAIAIRGTTVMATAEPGEPTHGGFTATRSVWYWWDVDYRDDQDWTITVESTEDCVVGLYNIPFGADEPDELNVLLQDDDSGPGNTPLIVWNAWAQSDEGDFDPGGWNGNYIAIVVDMKTEGDFVLKLERATTGTPPANDDFASATVISAIPFTASGTTVNATAEFFEPNAELLGAGPLDTVWYKYVATFNGQLTIKATCDSANDDAYVYIDGWRGTALETLVRNPNPPPSGPSGNPRGFFNWSSTPLQTETRAITLDVVSGQTYYIRVQTESGGSEDFTIYVEVKDIYIDIQPSGTDEMHGTLIDAVTVPIDIQVSSVEDFHQANVVDAATIYVNIQASGSDFMAKVYTDVASVYYNIQIDSHDCKTSWEPSQLVARIFDRFDGTANMRWVGTAVYDRFTVVAGDGLEEC